jgi:hypothetical protein
MHDRVISGDHVETIKLVYLPIEAAERVGISEREICSEIEAGRLLATRNEDGVFEIARRELDRWWRVERGGAPLFSREIHPHRASELRRRERSRRAGTFRIDSHEAPDEPPPEE